MLAPHPAGMIWAPYTWQAGVGAATGASAGTPVSRAADRGADGDRVTTPTPASSAVTVNRPWHQFESISAVQLS